jgi:hypothetical protein
MYDINCLKELNISVVETEGNNFTLGILVGKSLKKFFQRKNRKKFFNF